MPTCCMSLCLEVQGEGKEQLLSSVLDVFKAFALLFSLNF